MTQQNEQEELSIRLEDFNLWTEDKVTQTVFKYLEMCLDEVNKCRLDPKYIKDPNGLLQLNYFLGYEDAIQELLGIRSKLVEEVEDVEIRSTDLENLS